MDGSFFACTGRLVSWRAHEEQSLMNFMVDILCIEANEKDVVYLKLFLGFPYVLCDINKKVTSYSHLY